MVEVFLEFFGKNFCPAIGRKIRVGLEMLGGLFVRFVHFAKLCIAGRQQAPSLGRIVHLLHGLYDLVILIEVVLGATQMPEILVRVKRIEPHGTFQKCD